MLTEAQPGTPEFWSVQTPEAIAVIKGDRTMTYAEWNDRADRVAEGLADLGLQEGDRLGMRFRLSFEWFVIQRALQKLGVTQVAVNWRLTPDEAVYIIRDSGAKGLACNDVDASPWTKHGVGVLVTVGDNPGARYEDLVATKDPTPRFGAMRPSIVLYTSGTTGAPKGVPPLDLAGADFERLARYGASVGGVPPHPHHATVLMSLPVHHGAGAFAATGACATGGTAVLLDPFDPEEALRLIDQHRVQIWVSVPTMLLRIQALPEGALERYDVSSIEALTVGAAPVPQSLKQWVIAHFGNVLWEGYGTSEAGMITFMPPEHQLTKPGSSGIPFDGVEVAIVDEDWSRLPTGATGEIAVNTPVVLRGYLGRDPLGDDVLRDGFYRTGDVGHVDEDGFLFITDRIKDMIVAGGVNIYPAEIEKALVEHPDVEDAAVIGIPEPDFGEQALAFIVTRPGHSVTGPELLEFLDGRLASYKKPRQFEFVDALPVSPMGKVLKTELRAPYWKGHERNV
ncbi:MAG TPA: AMP-binding protein [Acidimicrobiales bacterium]|nr:AMP-binding protein [Acidimicrobiales bacterium]